jgi:maltose alpha-D-glucosyltransferase/alpha-amylase
VPELDPADTRWYQRAVFYEVLVRGFYDSTNDGTGDLKGLIAKLDYLQWLGVDCLWLLPFYDSPLRDGGYDISDFFSVLPEYGDIEDARMLIDEAHRRGMRVVADMVMNHTSDEHPWFQESRQDRTNPKADWYVWDDDDTRYGEARVIFVDTEPSNWTFDVQRGQYFWHRFFHHQPDLNYDNPEVAAAMLGVVRFWLDLGLDGFRLMRCPTCSSARAPTARTCPRPTSTCGGSARWWTTSTRGGCCWRRPTSGRWTSSTTSGPRATSATCASTSR